MRRRISFWRRSRICWRSSATAALPLVRELTKIHEEALRTTLSGAVRHFSETPPRGEFVLVLAGAEGRQAEYTPEQAQELARGFLAEGLSASEAAKQAAGPDGRKRAYLPRPHRKMMFPAPRGG